MRFCKQGYPPLQFKDISNLVIPYEFTTGSPSFFVHNNSTTNGSDLWFLTEYVSCQYILCTRARSQIDGTSVCPFPEMTYELLCFGMLFAIRINDNFSNRNRDWHREPIVKLTVLLDSGHSGGTVVD
jgi:hypothetical protein